MDGISNKVTMQINLNKEKEVDIELVKTKNRKLLADIEGELVIYIDSKVFFEDKYILLLEFGVLLSKWIKNIDSGNCSNFVYETMDYSEGPIIEIYEYKGDNWRVKSKWGQFDFQGGLSLCQIVDVSKCMINDLRIMLSQEYTIDFDDYLI